MISTVLRLARAVMIEQADVAGRVWAGRWDSVVRRLRLRRVKIRMSRSHRLSGQILHREATGAVVQARAAGGLARGPRNRLGTRSGNSRPGGVMIGAKEKLMAREAHSRIP